MFANAHILNSIVLIFTTEKRYAHPCSLSYQAWIVFISKGLPKTDTKLGFTVPDTIEPAFINNS